MDELEMALYACMAVPCTRRLSPARTLKVSRRVADLLGAQHGAPCSMIHASCDRAAQLAERWVRITSRGKGDCYDRASSARLWLARRGVGVTIVIGARVGARGPEGHAWIEDESGNEYLVEEGAGYTEVSRG